MTSFNQQLVSDIRVLVKQERRITREILEKIAIAGERRLYAELGYPSLLAWLVEDLKYTKQAAYRRIEGARLLRSVPVTSALVETGQVNVTTLSMLGTAIRQEEKRTNTTLRAEKKHELVSKIEGKSCEEADRVIAVEFPDLVLRPKESLRAVGEHDTKLNVVLNSKQFELLKRVKEVTSHSHFNASWAELIEVMATEFLRRKDPLQRKVREERRTAVGITGAANLHGARNSEKAECVDDTENRNDESNGLDVERVARSGAQAAMGASELPENSGALKYFGKSATDSAEGATENSMEIPADSSTEKSDESSKDIRSRGRDKTNKSGSSLSAQLRAKIIQRDGPRCTFRDERTQKICGSRLNIEIDHRQPRCLGGTNDPSNLRVLCRTHNAMVARQLGIMNHAE